MNKFNVIPILADILSDCAKEKVTRIILAVLRNLIEKPEDAQVSKEHCIAMVQCKVLKQLSILEQRRFDDEDITGDVEFLTEKLQNSVQDLSSFDEYSTEIKSGRLVYNNHMVRFQIIIIFKSVVLNGPPCTNLLNSGVKMLNV